MCFHTFDRDKYINKKIIQDWTRHLIRIIIMNMRSSLFFHTKQGWLTPFIPKMMVTAVWSERGGKGTYRRGMEMTMSYIHSPARIRCLLRMYRHSKVRASSWLNEWMISKILKWNNVEPTQQRRITLIRPNIPPLQHRQAPSHGVRPSEVFERNHLWPITRRELGDFGVLLEL